uniref:Secreted protein n=1 Tax=Setaria viridis TaxID=4556 RepID=A0A4U6SYU7_SETVI|nr:hypothetical protein SEVIR_9G278466v2 [Setaria viridis]
MARKIRISKSVSCFASLLSRLVCSSLSVSPPRPRVLAAIPEPHLRTRRPRGVLVPRNFFRLMNLKSILDSDSYSFSSMWGIRLVAAATDEPLLCMSVGNLSRQNG